MPNYTLQVGEASTGAREATGTQMRCPCKIVIQCTLHAWFRKRIFLNFLKVFAASTLIGVAGALAHEVSRFRVNVGAP